jgi:hypothetical protein
MHWGSWLFAIGGALWILKVVVITLNDAAGREVDAMPVPVFYLSAIVAMAIGATAVGVALLRNAPVWAQLVGAVVAFFALFVFYTVVDDVLKSAFEGIGPDWLHEELGILLTGAVALILGVWLARTLGRERLANALVSMSAP